MSDDYKPTVNGRASICHWELQFYFLTKEQCQNFITKFMAWDIPVNYSYREEEIWDRNSDPARREVRYTVEIEDMSWANNLTFVAKMLEEVDYSG